jgi:CTP:molybdopterin cytidylyltransferase MocA
MNSASATALVLSAGCSERMGDFKPLMRLGDMTVLERVVGLFQAAGVSRIHVVVGHRATEVIPLIERRGARSVMNARYREDMFSSVAAGVASLDDDTEAFFVLPVDIPLVRPATIRDLLQAFPSETTAICHPTFGGRRGHPPLIGRDHIGSILKWRREGGLTALLNRLEDHAVEVPAVDEFIHRDMDRPADYRRLVDRLRHRDVFSAAECDALLNDRLRVRSAVVAHGRAVAVAAARIGKALNQAGSSLNLHLIRAAAQVHDMARGKADHARCGAEMLQDLGMPQMAAVVATHMDMTLDVGEPISEAEVVFLADKLVREDRYVGLAERFCRRLDDDRADPEARDSARRKFETARIMAERIEAVIGRSLEGLLGEDREHKPTRGAL